MFLTKLWEMSPEDRTKLFANVKGLKAQQQEVLNNRKAVVSKKHNLVRGNRK